MNDKLNDSLAAILDAASKAGQDAYVFLQAQAPELCKEIVAWTFWSNTITACVCGFLVISFLVWCFLAYKNRDEWNEYGVMCGALVGTGIFIIATLVGCCALQEAIKAKVSPRLVVIEYVSELVKSNK